MVSKNTDVIYLTSVVNQMRILKNQEDLLHNLQLINNEVTFTVTIFKTLAMLFVYAHIKDRVYRLMMEKLFYFN